ncbi:MAG TPA: hypothetical protein VEK57_22775 [Thermoanaerobaculia bacterium]|nr:hypothetical protein [Thermoanaerobaculia bacterium]
MSTHLSQEDFILNYYRELDSREHLDACAGCREELDRLARVLDRVTPVEVPEPAGDYEARVWDRLSWRLRGEKRREQRGAWMKWAAVAAVVVLAFIAGFIAKNRNGVNEPQQIIAANPGTTATATSATAVAPATNRTQPNNTTQQQRDRILLVVVSDHFDRSERMLIELTNIAPAGGDTDFTNKRERAEELLASNRLYRRTALDRGEENVATLLDQLEPVLMQLAHAPSQVSAEELQSMQKRIEAKGLVFKLRVVQADVRATSQPRRTPQPTI